MRAGRLPQKNRRSQTAATATGGEDTAATAVFPQICCFFHFPCRNRMALAAAMADSAIRIDK